MSKIQYVLLLAVALVAGLVGGVGSSWFLMGVPVSVEKQPHHIAEVIQAQKFQVVNDEGKVLADLGVDRDGDIALALLDNDKIIRAQLALDHNGTPRLDFYTHGNPFLGQFHVSLDKEGNPLLHLWDAQEGGGALSMTGTALEVHRKGYGSLHLGIEGTSSMTADKEGHILFGPETDIDVRLELFDDDGNTRAKLEQTNLELRDADDHLRAVLGQINLEYPHTGTIENRHVSSLVLFGKNGKSFWQTP